MKQKQQGTHLPNSLPFFMSRFTVGFVFLNSLLSNRSSVCSDGSSVSPWSS